VVADVKPAELPALFPPGDPRRDEPLSP